MHSVWLEQVYLDGQPYGMRRTLSDRLFVDRNPKIKGNALTGWFLVTVLRGDSKVSGTVVFEQESESAPTTITWDISGQDANAKRGFHIHTFGDNTNGCTSAGPHFNPHNKTHGAPADEARHVGDLGNIETDAQGNAKGSVKDSLVKLIGPHSIIGRTVVVHAGTDDLGKGDNEESLKTGNAGPRPACGKFNH
ncbi:hypothetical protein Golomagni_06099 [Golovinomyces magnicellulatus]|nr:hypothetical protein Golomagni_06099 [Golovinomyces magnicellulatus]